MNELQYASLMNELQYASQPSASPVDVHNRHPLQTSIPSLLLLLLPPSTSAYLASIWS
jgi:hypothetical protein